LVFLFISLTIRGVFSVPSYGCSTAAEWYWQALESGSNCTIDYHKKTYGADFKYADFAKSFTAELFDPNQWADTFANVRIFNVWLTMKSGAKYVVLTSKHHEGYTLWPSAQAWNWNSVDVGPHKDLVGLLTDAVRAKGLRMGLYHSLYIQSIF
jgi:alpha-L-fucosidase